MGTRPVSIQDSNRAPTNYEADALLTDLLPRIMVEVIQGTLGNYLLTFLLTYLLHGAGYYLKS
jgi:hypothetical protein